ncbi:MAG TPA: hypothetical protein VFP61_07620 [Acidimicrobiales bacterium]|nr:hypothetical protein [Acidimicrobiales bacterium]
MDFTAESLYGAVPSVQPTGMPTAQPMPEATAPMRTTSHRPGLLAQPSFWLVALLGIAVGLIKISIRFS